jgi:hypothetical protein
MRYFKSLVFCFGAGMALASQAGLALVGETKESIIYINLDAAEKKGDVVKAEGSQDFHQQQTLAGQNYLSAKFVHEFDCEKKQARQLSLNIYPENMANGGALQTDNEAKPWAAPIAGSAVDMMWKKACAAKP